MDFKIELIIACTGIFILFYSNMKMSSKKQKLRPIKVRKNNIVK